MGGRGRLSSIQAAELNGEAHATLAQLLVLMEIPGELGEQGAAMSSTRRVTAISCNECPTPELRMKCGCVGNTGFNTVSRLKLFSEKKHGEKEGKVRLRKKKTCSPLCKSAQIYFAIWGPCRRYLLVRINSGHESLEGSVLGITVVLSKGHRRRSY